MAVKIVIDKCTGCGICISSCPLDVIKIKNNIAVIDQNNCSECGSCVSSCPAQAIELE